MGALGGIFDSGFMPHGHCYQWRPDILWLNVGSDALIALAYFSIPLALVHLLRRRQDLPFQGIFLLFVTFILACGATHLVGIYTVWHGAYGLHGTVKAFTAVVSLATASVLWPLLPKAVALPSAAELRAANTELAKEVEERTRVEETLRDARDFAAELMDRTESALSGAEIGAFHWEIGAERLEWSATARQALRFGESTMPTEAADALAALHPDDRERVQRALLRTARGEGRTDEHVRISGVEGRVFSIRAERVRRPPHPPALTGVMLDVTDRVHAEEQGKLAFYDPLTGLPNRRLFGERLNAAARSARERGVCGAVLFLDLDRFKEINDTLGHRAGDELLSQVADRVVNTVRLRDVVLRDNASVSRLGGDEFTLILNDLPKAQTAGRVARRILRALAEPFELEGQEVRTSASIGIAVFPDDGEDVDALVPKADRAMYRAKAAGPGQYRFFTPDMEREGARRMAIEQRLRRAAPHEALALHYQPIVAATSGEVVAVEALLRLADGGEPVGPAEFIPIAEDAGLIGELGRWVLQRACADARRWGDLGHPAGVCVNLSGLQLRGEGLAERVERILRETRLDPHRLSLEITESVLMADHQGARDTLERLRSRGVALAMDDFGTGFASLAYLRQLPFDSLKIDRSFVAGLADEGHDARLAAAMIDLAHRLGLKVVAEGVETEAQAYFLRDHGCDLLQGYLFSRPVPVEELTAFLAGGSGVAGRGRDGERA